LPFSHYKFVHSVITLKGEMFRFKMGCLLKFKCIIIFLIFILHWLNSYICMPVIQCLPMILCKLYLFWSTVTVDILFHIVKVLMHKCKVIIYINLWQVSSTWMIFPCPLNLYSLGSDVLTTCALEQSTKFEILTYSIQNLGHMYA